LNIKTKDRIKEIKEAIEEMMIKFFLENKNQTENKI
jgi:hypothetical protein